MILDEVEKFSNKTKEEKDTFSKNVIDILHHNQNLFLNYSKDKLFINDCAKILRNLTQTTELI